MCFFSGHSLGGEKHINKIPPKIPGQSRESFVYVFFSLCVFCSQFIIFLEWIRPKSCLHWCLSILLGNGPNTVSESTVSNANSVSFSGLTEFRRANSVSSFQPFLFCVPKRTHRVFSQNSPSSLFRNNALETVFRPFPICWIRLRCGVFTECPSFSYQCKAPPLSLISVSSHPFTQISSYCNTQKGGPGKRCFPNQMLMWQRIAQGHFSPANFEWMPKGSCDTTHFWEGFWEGSGEGFQKGSKKGACYGFCS